MKKLMNWLSESFAPSANKLFSKPWIAAISSAMQKVVPFILTGSLINFYNVFRSFVPALPDLSPIANYSFGLISILVAFMMANQCMEKLQHPEYTVNAGLVAICIMVMVSIPTGEATDSFSSFLGNVGPTGISAGMISGLFVAFVFHLWAKLKFLRNTSIPDFVVAWVNLIIPNVIVLGITMVLIFNLKISILNVIVSIFMPLAKGAQTLPGFILISLLYAFFYTLGISTWLWDALTAPIFLVAIQENMDAVAAGGVATNIVTSEVFFTMGFIAMGGVCATLGLNVLMCFSKSRQLKMLGRVFIAPAIFNINEPLMFGAPIVFNPLLMLPAWINAIVGPTYVWILMSTGLLKIPSMMVQVGQIPAPASSVMITQDIRAILWWAILLVIYTAIWYPFFKVYEKNKLTEEAAQ